jgi:hypothetical protein
MEVFPFSSFYAHFRFPNTEAKRAVLGKGRGLTEGLDALLQQLVFIAAILTQHAQIHGCHDLADFLGAGACLVTAGLPGPTPSLCLSIAFLMGFPVDTAPRNHETSFLWVDPQKSS